MSFPRHQEIFPSDGGASPAANAPAHRLDEFPTGYSSASWSPPEPASASPAGHQYAVIPSCWSRSFHRTVNCVLTVCVSRGGKRIALLALVLHVSPVGPEQRSESGSRQTDAKPGAAKNPDTGACDSCPTELEGPWLATRAIFAPQGPAPARPKGLGLPHPNRNAQELGKRAQSVRGFFGIAKSSRVETVLATVADPWHTRLALSTDSALDEMEAAATASGWVFAAQWLPWIDPIDPETKDPSKRRRQRRVSREQEDEPGILVFRQEVNADRFVDTLLVVFVVGDTPTGGIDRSQFRRARSYMTDLDSSSGPVLMLAPQFSGSFRSLSDLLVEDTAAYYEIRSGMASSIVDANATVQSVARVGRKVCFHGADLSSKDFSDFFNKALVSLDIPGQEAAILAEDETRFGTAVKPKDSSSFLGVMTLKFPRDISQLRNAYRGSKSLGVQNTLPPEVEFSLKDGEAGEDSIPSYSGAQGPLSQDARLEQAVDTIRRDHIRAVEIIATNVLDVMFLTRVLQQKSPDTRIILPNANLLFVEAARTDALRNVLALSSYPVMAERRWLLDPAADRRDPLLIHPDSVAEADYNAMVLLLDKGIRVPGHELDRELNDYGWNPQQHPPVWLLSLDRQGFLPLRAWTHDMNDDESWWEKRPEFRGETVFMPTQSITVWNLVTGVIELAALGALTFCILLGLSHPRWDGRFLPVAIHQNDRWRIVYLANIFLVLASMLAILCLPWLKLGSPWYARVGLTEAAVLGIGALVMGAMIHRTLSEAEETPNRADIALARFAVMISLIAYGAAVETWWWACSVLDDSGGDFFCLRAVEMRIGSCPTLPILAALFAVGLFCYVQLHRIYLATCQEPSVVHELGSVLQSRLETNRRSLSDHFGSRFGVRLPPRLTQTVKTQLTVR